MSGVDSGLYSGVASMRSNEKRLEAITANLANVGTVAYKRLSSVTQAFETMQGTTRVQQIATRHSTDFSQGDLERTGNTLDLALEGDGFFVVDTAQGPAYTRDGAFHVDQNGVLQTSHGDAVAWDGAPARIVAIGQPLTIDGSGAVRQGSNAIGRLRVVDFARKERLELDEKGLLHAPSDLTPSASSATVHQGALERSNASSIDELVALVRVQRNFESAASLMRSIDQSYRRLNAQR